VDITEIAIAAAAALVSGGGTYALMQYKLERLQAEFSELRNAMEKKMDLKDFEAHRRFQEETCRKTHEAQEKEVVRVDKRFDALEKMFSDLRRELVELVQLALNEGGKKR
jgi:uncharacterized protein HemX